MWTPPGHTQKARVGVAVQYDIPKKLPRGGKIKKIPTTAFAPVPPDGDKWLFSLPEVKRYEPPPAVNNDDRIPMSSFNWKFEMPKLKVSNNLDEVDIDLYPVNFVLESTHSKRIHNISQIRKVMIRDRTEPIFVGDVGLLSFSYGSGFGYLIDFCKRLQN